MHWLGKDFLLSATFPDGSKRTLIKIDRWDFNWQDLYDLAEPVALPKGTRIDMVAHFDNSAANPTNPTNPPVTVGWGEQTTDEMCLLGVQVVTENLADLRKIIAMRGNRLGAALMGGDAAEPGDRPAAGVMRELRSRLNAEGLPIPERFKQQLGRFDKNNDGKLSRQEIDAMPDGIRNRVRDAIEQRLGEGQ
jgi:hypothetical protein